MPRLRSLGLVVLGAALALLGVGAVAAARGLLADPETRTYETEEFSFDYPGTWREIEGLELPLREQAAARAVEDDTVGLDLDSWVTVFTDPVPFEVTPRNVSDVVGPARDLYAETFGKGGGRVLQEAYVVREAGAPGVRTRLAYRSNRGVAVENETTTLYRGRIAYTVSCQNRPERTLEIAAGCERVLETLRPRR